MQPIRLDFEGPLSDPIGLHHPLGVEVGGLRLDQQVHFAMSFWVGTGWGYLLGLVEGDADPYRLVLHESGSAIEFHLVRPGWVVTSLAPETLPMEVPVVELPLQLLIDEVAGFVLKILETADQPPLEFLYVSGISDMAEDCQDLAEAMATHGLDPLLVARLQARLAELVAPAEAWWEAIEREQA
jgi:hypothetical protein